MTMHEILKLAYMAQLNNWDRERKAADALPGNEYAAARERNAWEKLQEIENLLRAEEQKQK